MIRVECRKPQREREREREIEREIEQVEKKQETIPAAPEDDRSIRRS